MSNKIQQTANAAPCKSSGRLKAIVDAALPIAILLVYGLALTSCLKENLSDCPEDIRVYFDISTRADGDAINPKNVDRMNLYVFNHKGYYLCEYVDEQIDDFDDKYYIDCSDLLPGKYRFIAWGGMDRDFFSATPIQFEKGKTTFDEALLMLTHLDGIISTPVHHLFHSELPATVTYSKVQRFKMPLIQITNTVNVRTVGLPADSYAYTYEITGDNCTYQFDGEFVKCSHGYAHHDEHDDFKYVAPCTKDEAAQLHSTLNVMRLSKDFPTVQLKIYDEAGTILYPTGNKSGNLIELITKANPKNDFDATHNYDIVLAFNESDLSLTIYINGWKVKEDSGQLVD